MYGMIHRGCQHAVLKLYGTEVWLKCLKHSGLKEEHFISAAYHTDEITLKLITAISEECNLSIKDVLRAAGRHWIEYTKQAGYESILTLTGKTLPDFLENLDRMHESLNRTLPEAILPSFQLVSVETDRLKVIYRSAREGFEELVFGIMEGVIEHFEAQMTLEYEIKADGTYFTLERAVTLPLSNKSYHDALDMVG